METSRFDALARSLAIARSRRKALGGLLVGTLGLLAGSGPEEVVAKSGKCKPKCGECQTCKKGDCDRKRGKKTCKKGKCKPKGVGTACTAAAGGSGACQAGVCVATPVASPITSPITSPVVCATGLSDCGGACVNTKTDEANCGACGTVCTANQVCQQDGQGASCFPTGACPAATTGLCHGFPTPCSGVAAGCFCDRSIEGNVVCVSFRGVGGECPPVGRAACNTSADCPTGEACVDISDPACCPLGTRICVRKCPAPVPA